MTGIEPVTSSLPRKRSTPELHRRNLERKTGFEPATLSLEGWCSTSWATSAVVGGAGFEPAKVSQRIYSPSSLAAWVSPPGVYKIPLENQAQNVSR